MSTQIRIALLGFSIPAMEGVDGLGRPFLAVVPPAFESYMVEHDIPHEVWDYDCSGEHADELAQRLARRGVEVAVPLYEETVEWAGMLNGRFRADPRLITRYQLFRDKAMMKRRAQMSGLRVGVFEEAENKKDVHHFLQSVNKALIKIAGDAWAPVHLKPVDAAGSKGHHVLKSDEDVDELTDADFPCLLESHLDGQEFSCEVFVHDGKIRFLNINEYVHLGYSNFSPAGPGLQEHRDLIRKTVEDLIAAFEIQHGVIHPEFFITPDQKISFGEVAARVPGGHIFDLIERAYGFNPFAGFVLCADPETSDEELDAFFPDWRDHDGYAGCLMVYPKRRVVTRVSVPDKLFAEAYYEKHNLLTPISPKVAERVAFGDHYGTVFFHGPDAAEMRRLLCEYEDEEFYVGDCPPPPQRSSS